MAARIAVVGGGITGTVAALRLSEQGAEVILVEASDRLGGKVQTSRLGEATIELGADSFLPRDDRPLQLCREIGIAEELVAPSDFGAWIYRAGALHRMPAGTVLGAPASVRSLAASNLLSWHGKARASLDLLRRRPLTGPDVSVGSFLRARLGAEVVDRMVDPLLAGTRAGDVSEMSLAAAIPPIDHAARTTGSLIRGLSRAAATSSWKPSFHAPTDGMSRFVEALEAKLQTVEIKKGRRVAALSREGSGYVLESDDSAAIEADAVLLATPSYVAADLLQHVAPDASKELGRIGHASAAVVNLLFPRDSVTVPTGGSGVLVPSSERMTVAGCTWFSHKWPALAAPDGGITIRCFVGRGDHDPALDLDDRDLVGVVLAELQRLVEVSDEPTRSDVRRWERALPQYKVGHLERISHIEKLLVARHPLLAVAGASFRGSGIPDCMAQAERAAAWLLGRAQR